MDLLGKAMDKTEQLIDAAKTRSAGKSGPHLSSLGLAAPHCCIKLSARPSWSTWPPRSQTADLRIPGCYGFQGVEGPALPLRAMARTPFTLMQLCPRWRRTL